MFPFSGRSLVENLFFVKGDRNSYIKNDTNLKIKRELERSSILCLQSRREVGGNDLSGSNNKLLRGA